MDRSLETDEVLALLRGTDIQLRNDQRDGFLMPSDVVHSADGRSRIRRWSALAVRRAKRLYRLRSPRFRHAVHPRP